MSKTLADMTAEEREECVGMWCDNLASTADNPQPVVLACVQGERCWVLHTGLHGEWSCFSLGSVSPRFDLPRAWESDGEPVDGAWEKSTAELPTKNYKATFTQHYRRWVGDWEQDNE